MFGLVLLVGSTTAGCSYECHTYQYVNPTVDNGRWKVSGELTRAKPETQLDYPGSFPHWEPDPEDRYTLVLVPVSSDPKYWLHGSVEIRNVRVLCEGQTVGVEWTEPGARRLVSYPFHIPAAPDLLPIEYDLQLIDTESGSITREIHIDSHAVADRHRRWYIVDMINS